MRYLLYVGANIAADTEYVVEFGNEIASYEVKVTPFKAHGW